jgi:hypothetical protein
MCDLPHCWAFADGRIAALRAQLDRLEEEKADITLVTQYTGQVSTHWTYQ